MQVQVLMICTANIARSPLAAAIFGAHVAGSDLTQTVTVESAGVRARVGDPAARASIEIARQWDLDLRDHRSQPVTPGLLEASTLIVTMTAQQRDDLGARTAQLGARCFTLRELVRLIGAIEVDGLASPAAERLTEVVRRAHLQRPRSTPTGPEDIADPYGRSRRHYVEMANELQATIGTIAPVLLGPRS